jgi:hypothetical protein
MQQEKKNLLNCFTQFLTRGKNERTDSLVVPCQTHQRFFCQSTSETIDKKDDSWIHTLVEKLTLAST